MYKLENIENTFKNLNLDLKSQIHLTHLNETYEPYDHSQDVDPEEMEKYHRGDSFETDIQNLKKRIEKGEKVFHPDFIDSEATQKLILKYLDSYSDDGTPNFADKKLHSTSLHALVMHHDEPYFLQTAMQHPVFSDKHVRTYIKKFDLPETHASSIATPYYAEPALENYLTLFNKENIKPKTLLAFHNKLAKLYKEDPSSSVENHLEYALKYFRNPNFINIFKNKATPSPILKDYISVLSRNFPNYFRDNARQPNTETQLLLDHPNLPKTFINSFLNSKNPDDTAFILNSKHIPSDILKKIHDTTPHAYIKHNIIKNPNFNPEHYIDQFQDTSDTRLHGLKAHNAIASVLQNPSLSSDQLTSINDGINNYATVHKDNSSTLSEYEKFRGHTLDSITNDLKNSIIMHPNAPDNLIKNIVQRRPHLAVSILERPLESISPELVAVLKKIKPHLTSELQKSYYTSRMNDLASLRKI